MSSTILVPPPSASAMRSRMAPWFLVKLSMLMSEIAGHEGLQGVAIETDQLAQNT
jgi:hypothetical protein